VTTGPGSVIGERYVLECELGAGGMAEVYLANDRLLDRQVAVKVLSARYAADPAFVGRFEREARSAASVNHPNIVAVHDRGETAGTYYIVMEYFDGVNLKEVISRRAPLQPHAAIDYMLQILAALGAAHARDIIHLDVKPQNMLVSDDGLLKVTDFGIARVGGRSDLTATGWVIGTAQYLSPEQARGDDLTPASDCYSAGIVLYELLTGRVPFDGDQPIAVAVKHLNEPPVPPTAYQRQLPDQLDAIVMRALAKHPAERYPTAGDFTEALRAVRASRGSVLSAVVETGPRMMTVGGTRLMQRPEPTGPTEVTPTRPPRAASRQRREPKRSRRSWIVALALVVLVSLAGGLFLVGRDDDAIRVPDVAGLSTEDAEQRLRTEGLENFVTREIANDTRAVAESAVEPGRVVGTSPAATTKVAANTRITIQTRPDPPPRRWYEQAAIWLRDQVS
jgi:serine/threonine-protein kinase